MIALNKNIGKKRSQPIEENAIVSIDGRVEITGAFVYKGKENTPIIVPLLKTLSSLGVDIHWKNANSATLKYKAKQYAVDLVDETFVPINAANDNLLLPPPGCVFGNQIIDKDILVEYGLFNYIARKMEIDYVSAEFDDVDQCLYIYLADE